MGTMGVLEQRSIAATGLKVSRLGYGAFKIGRNEKIKYPKPYSLPDESEVGRLLAELVDHGITYFDTAPAYGLSEERLGRLLPQGSNDLVISTKVGEIFDGQTSRYQFDRSFIQQSLETSARRLNRSVLDLVFIHSDGHDLEIQQQTDAVPTLQELKRAGSIRGIGFSGKTIAGAIQALDWADAIMVEYHLQDVSHALVIAQASRRNIAVIVKKGLAAGHLPAEAGIQFVLKNPDVTSLVIGGLNLQHWHANIDVAVQSR